MKHGIALVIAAPSSMVHERSLPRAAPSVSAPRIVESLKGR
jgi:hypothetical protein